MHLQRTLELELEPRGCSGATRAIYIWAFPLTAPLLHLAAITRRRPAHIDRQPSPTDSRSDNAQMFDTLCVPEPGFLKLLRRLRRRSATTLLVADCLPGRRRQAPKAGQDDSGNVLH